MKRIFLALALALPVCATAAPALAIPYGQLAPADRYFGRMKMSILGIRNSIKDLSQAADNNPGESEHIFDKAVLVEDALRDWQQQFPRDPWIPKYAYSLAMLYQKLDYIDARGRADAMIQWLDRRYPESEYAGVPRY